jgi:hypothetical protein
LAWENGDVDPLLGCLTGARERILSAERDRRLLLAYAREFAMPRPYRLEDLARALACPSPASAPHTTTRRSAT